MGVGCTCGAQVISEDSDMLAYGCPRVLFKLDKGGEGQEVCAVDLPHCRSPSFAGFNPDMFLEVGGLAGPAAGSARSAREHRSCSLMAI